jgi:DNA-binding response OmpR family regulator
VAKLLIVEDDLEFADVLSIWLETQGYLVEKASNGEDALQLLSAFKYDLLIFDWELPGVTGVDVCQTFRKQGGTTPILFLTGKADVDSKVTGLETGADDYMCKPIDFRELGARLRTLLRRPSGLHASVLKAAGITLDTDTHRVKVSDVEVSLSPREYSLLEYLMRHTNKSFSSKALLDSVWTSDSAMSEDTVRSTMRGLRKKITLDGTECAIKTVAGYGYTIPNDAEPASERTPAE